MTNDEKELELIKKWERDNDVIAVSINSDGDVDSELYFSMAGCDTNPSLGNEVYDCQFLNSNKDLYDCTLSHRAICYFYNGE